MKKITVNFNIQYKNKKISPILLSVTWEGKRVQLSTGISVETASFDILKGKVKNSYSHASEINQYLRSAAQNISSKYFSLSAVGIEFTKDNILEFLKKEVNSTNIEDSEKKSPLYILEHLENFIKENSGSKKISYRSIQKYRTLRNHIINFEKKSKIKLLLENSDKNHFDKFALFLSKELVNPSIEKYLRSIKVIINDAFNLGLIKSNKINNIISQTVKDYNINKQTLKETLTENDLKLIEDYSPSTQRLIFIKDLFLSQIYTGLRYSDLNQIRREVIDFNRKLIKINQTKTQDYVEVNLSSKLFEILQKYDNFSFVKPNSKLISNQKYNDGIKELCREAGITYDIQIVKYKLKERIVNFIPKWEVISSHYARSTFATLSLMRGILPEEVMQVTGHKDRSSFQKYVKISKNQALSNVHRVWEEK